MKTMSTLNHHHHHHHRPPSHLTTVGGKGDAVSKKELDVFNVARRRRMTTTRRQCCATKTTTTTTRRTEAYYYSSLLVVFDGRKRNATKVRAYARDYPTYDELGDGFNRGVGGWRDKHPADGTGNAEKDFFFADQISQQQQQQQQQQPERGHQQHHHRSSSSSVAVSSTLSSAARDWFETCFGLLKMTVPLTAACACVAAASMDSARYTMSGQVYSLATGMTTGGVIISGFAVLASVISGFFVATSAFADFGGTSMSSANKRRKGKKNNNAASRQQQQQQQQQQNTMGYEQQGYVDPSYEQQKYQQQQQQHRRQPVERYDPPIVYPTRPPSSPSKRAAREAYDAWTPEVPIVDPRAQIPRPSDVDYYSSSRRTGGSKDTQPDWDKNESWGSYKSPGQRRRELGYEFKGTDALKNYVDPRDQYERRVSNHSPEAEYIYNQHNIRSNDELRAPRHDINNYTNTVPERDRLIPKPMERPKPGYIPTEVLIAMGGASLSSHIKTKVEDGSIREMRRQKEEFNKKKESNATNMFGEKLNTNNMFRRGP